MLNKINNNLKIVYNKIYNNSKSNSNSKLLIIQKYFSRIKKKIIAKML